MCGIVGIMDWTQSAVCGKELGIFMQMLHADAVRGMHGTGLFAVDKQGARFRMRVGGPPHQLVASKEYDKFESFIGGHYVRFIVGHNRYATRGGISTETSHPFTDGDITLVHNGTLDTFHHLPDSKKYNVDSEALCHAISVDGAEKVIPTLKGAWTLVWWDASAQTLNMVRNDQRPLYVARGKNNLIAFASEADMLNWILFRNEKYDMEIKELPVDTLFSYGLDSSKPHVKELKGKAADKTYLDKGWLGFGGTARDEAVGSGKVLVESESKASPTLLLLPPVPVSQKKNGKNTSGAQNDSTNRGSLQENKKAGGKAPKTSADGYWVTSESIHDITKANKIVVLPMEAVAVSNKAKEKGLFLIRLLSEKHPDVDFMLYVKGKEELTELMSAPEGIRADVKTILRSMNQAARHPHRVFLMNPQAMYTPEPNVPEHAHTGT